MNQQQERRKEEEPRIEVDLISGRLKVLTRHVDKWRRRGGSVEITTTLSTKTRIRTKQERKKEGSNCCITVVCSFFVPLFSNQGANENHLVKQIYSIYNCTLVSKRLDKKEKKGRALVLLHLSECKRFGSANDDGGRSSALLKLLSRYSELLFLFFFAAMQPSPARPSAFFVYQMEGTGRQLSSQSALLSPTATIPPFGQWQTQCSNAAPPQ